MRGLSILEVVVGGGVAVISVVMFGFMIGARGMLRVSAETAKLAQASFILEEGG